RVHREAELDTTARGRVALEQRLVAALQAGHVDALDAAEHGVGRQRRVIERLLARDLDAALRNLLFLVAARAGVGAVRRVDLGAVAGARTRVAVAAGAAVARAADLDVGA